MDADELRALVEALNRLPGVLDVQTAHAWVEPLARLRRGLRLGGLALAAAVGLGAVAAATGATTAVHRAGAEEVRLLRLAGVSKLRLGVPSVLQAVVLATLGSVLGLLLLLVASEPGAPWAAGWLRATLALDPLPLLPLPWMAALTGGGAALGLIGALAAGRARGAGA
jgi:cell division protein FtsX